MDVAASQMGSVYWRLYVHEMCTLNYVASRCSDGTRSTVRDFLILFRVTYCTLLDSISRYVWNKM